MRTYVINLDRQPGRMERMIQQLAEVEFCRVPAVEGAKLEGPERRLKDVPTSPEELTRFERAVALSHREVWRQHLSSGQRFACVLEDDVHLSQDFQRFMHDERWVPADADVVKIESFSRRKVLLAQELCVFAGRSVRKLLSNNLGAAGYVLSAQGAEKLLRLTEVLSRPIDHTLFEDWLEDERFSIFQLSPALCIQSSRLNSGASHPEFDSTIQSGKQHSLTVPEKMTRELKRPFLTSHKFLRNFIVHRLNQGKFERVEFV